MAQIYTEQVKPAVDLQAPDTSIMKYAAESNAQATSQLQKLAQNTIAIEEKRQLQESESVKDLTKKSALQVISNAYTTFPNDPVKYKEVTDKGLKDIYEAIPDQKVRARIQAEVGIDKSGYDTKVNKNYRDKQEKIYNERYRDSVISTVDASTSSLSNGYFTQADIKNYTPEELMARANAYKDSEAKLYQAYNQRYAQDSNGNFIFNVTEREAMKDKFENRAFYGALDYVQDNVQTNYEASVRLRDHFANNKQLVMEKYNIKDDASYNKIIDGMDKIISGEKTADTLKQIQSTQVALEANYNEMGIKPDATTGELKVTNKRNNNLNSTIGLLTAYDEAEAKGMYTSKADKIKLTEQRAKVNQVVIDQIESNVGVKGKKWWNFGAETNVGETAIAQSQKNLTEIVNALGITDKNEVLSIKSKLYRDTLKSLTAANVELTSKEGKDLAQKVANKAYYDYVKGVVGNVQIKEGEDPRAKLVNAMLNRRNQVSLNNIQYSVDRYLEGR